MSTTKNETASINQKLNGALASFQFPPASKKAPVVKKPAPPKPDNAPMLDAIDAFKATEALATVPMTAAPALVPVEVTNKVTSVETLTEEQKKEARRAKERAYYARSKGKETAPKAKAKTSALTAAFNAFTVAPTDENAKALNDVVLAIKAEHDAAVAKERALAAFDEAAAGFRGLPSSANFSAVSDAMLVLQQLRG